MNGAWNNNRNNQNSNFNQQPGFAPQQPIYNEPAQSATEYFQEMIDKVTKGIPQNNEKSLEYWINRIGGKRWKMHPKKISKSWRACKDMSTEIDRLKVLDDKETNKSLQMPVSFKNKGDNQSSTSYSKDSQMPINGDSITFNINNLLRENIMMSQYFKELMRLQYLEEVIQEIKKNTRHAEPWAQQSSSTPSTMF